MREESDLSPPEGNPAGNACAARGADGSRRRFLKGGALGAPVVLTLTSRPVFGVENACVAPSRMISGNFSGFTGPASCGGQPRSYYVNQVRGEVVADWPDWARLRFATELVIPAVPYESNNLVPPPPPANRRVGRVLINSFNGHDANSHAVSGFASYIIAAYQNALTIPSVSAVLTPTQVIHMWNDVVGTGQYCPQLAMCWDANGVIGYLQNSGIVPS